MLARALIRHKVDVIAGGKRFANDDYAHKLLVHFSNKQWLDRAERTMARAALADTLFLMDVVHEMRELQQRDPSTSWLGGDRLDLHFVDFGDYASHSADEFDEFFASDEGGAAAAAAAATQASLTAETFDERLNAMLREYAVASGSTKLLDGELWARVEGGERRHGHSLHKPLERVRKVAAYVGAFGYLQLLVPDSPDSRTIDRVLAAMPRLYASVAVAIDALSVAVDAALLRVWLLWRDIAGHEAEIFESVLECVDKTARDESDAIGLSDFLRPRLGRPEALRFLARQLDTYMLGRFDSESLDDTDGDDEDEDDEEMASEFVDFLAPDDADDGGVSSDVLRRELDDAIGMHGAKRRRDEPPTFDDIEREFAEQRERAQRGRATEQDDEQRRRLFAPPPPTNARPNFDALVSRARPDALGGVQLVYRRRQWTS